MKKFFVNVQGGTGMNIALASTITAIKNQYPAVYEFAVLSGYSDIFESCPAVDDVYKPNEIRDFIFDAVAQDGTIINHRLYDMDGFIKKQLNYEQAWRMLFNIDAGLEIEPMDISSELDPLKAFPGLEQSIKQAKEQLKKYDEYVIMQFTGGQSPLVQVPVENNKPQWDKVPYRYDNEPLRRHYPIDKAQAFIDLFKKDHPNTGILLYQLPNEPAPKGVVSLTMPYLAYYELGIDDKCKGIVAIDSSLQHLLAGKTNGVVLWAHSKPETFGYKSFNNIIQPCRTDDLLYFTALGPSAAKVQYIEPKELLQEVNNTLWV